MARLKNRPVPRKKGGPRDDPFVKQRYDWLTYSRESLKHGIKVGKGRLSVSLSTPMGIPILVGILLWALGFRNLYWLGTLILIFVLSVLVSTLAQSNRFWGFLAWWGLPLAFRKLNVPPNEAPLMLDVSRFICSVLTAIAAGILFWFPDRVVHYQAGIRPPWLYLLAEMGGAFLITSIFDRWALFRKSRFFILLTGVLWVGLVIVLGLWLDATTNRVLCPSFLWYCHD